MIWIHIFAPTHTQLHTQDPNSNWLNWALFVSGNREKRGEEGRRRGKSCLFLYPVSSFLSVVQECLSLTILHFFTLWALNWSSLGRGKRGWGGWWVVFLTVYNISSFRPNQYSPSFILYTGTWNFRQSGASWVIRQSIFEALLLNTEILQLRSLLLDFTGILPLRPCLH